LYAKWIYEGDTVCYGYGDYEISGTFYNASNVYADIINGTGTIITVNFNAPNYKVIYEPGAADKNDTVNICIYTDADDTACPIYKEWVEFFVEECPCDFTQPSPADTAVCNGNSATFNLAKAIGADGPDDITYLWQQSTDGITWTPAEGMASGGTDSTLINYTTPPLTDSIYYRRVATSIKCGTITSDSALVRMLTLLIAPTVSTDQSFCDAATGLTVADLQPQGDHIQWYNPVSVPVAPTTSLSAGVYYARQIVNGCISAETSAVLVSILPETQLPAPDLGTIYLCTGTDVADLKLLHPEIGNIYADATTTTAFTGTLIPGTYYTTGYYVAGDCESSERKPFTVTITDGIATPIEFTETLCEGATFQNIAAKYPPYYTWFTRSGTTYTPVNANFRIPTAGIVLYFKLNAGACETANYYGTVTVTIPNDNVDSPTAPSPQSFCGDVYFGQLNITGYNLTITGSGGTEYALDDLIPVGTYIYSVIQQGNGTCASDQPLEIEVTVGVFPDVDITGDDDICVDDITQLSPTTGGTWTSSNPAVAIVTNGGVVTGKGTGRVAFTFTVTATGCSATTDSLTVSPLYVYITEDTICVNDITILSPTSGGTWVSSNPAIATVENDGTVTGIAAGRVAFTFTDDNKGCFATTDTITVNPIPTVYIDGSDDICIDITTLVVSTTGGGTWTSSNPAIASVAPDGTVTGRGSGKAVFTYTYTATGCSATTDSINVHPLYVYLTKNEICVDETIIISPTTGGTWTSSDPAVASITNDGVVTGIAAGKVVFTFSEFGGCSAPTDTLTVKPLPTLSSATTLPDICSETTFNYTATSSTAGTTYIWERAMIPGILPPTAEGVTGTISEEVLINNTTAPITVIYEIFLTANGCENTQEIEVAVLPIVTPSISISAPPFVCEGMNITFNSTITNGGTHPAYQWIVNGNPVPGAINESYTYFPSHGDVVTAMLIADAAICPHPDTVYPATATMVTVIDIDAPVLISDTLLAYRGMPVDLSSAVDINPIFTYVYYENPDKTGIISGSTVIYNPPKDDYYVAASNGSCEGPVSKIILKDPCPPNITDEEGNVYKVTSLAGLCWTENLRTTIYPATTDTVPFAKPYTCSGCPSQLDTIFGLLYTWYSAVGKPEGSTEPLTGIVQGICPDGWYIPSQAEWNLLEQYDANMLRSTDYWLDPPGSGTDDYDFDARPAGLYNNRFENLYGFAGWWASDVSLTSTIANYFSITYYCDKLEPNVTSKNNALSVRCVIKWK